MLKLEVLVCPERTEQDHHADVDEQVKHEVDAGHDDATPYRVDGDSHDRQQWEVQEPDDVAHCQDDVQPQCCTTVLNEVDLSHLVQDVYQDEQPVD